MPTLISMIQHFAESSYKYDDKKYEKILFDNENYSLVRQEAIKQIQDKNIIKSTNKTILNTQIAEAIEESLKNMKHFKDKVLGKEIYNEMANYLNENYCFNIDLTRVNETIIGTPEERCMYLLRQTEREYYRGERKNLTEISEELGCSRRALEKDIKKMTEQGFKLLGMNIKLVDEDKNILKMESTPHMVILMQNISQLLVLLEGLRAMEKVRAFNGYARNTACSIWNQLTEYTREKILDALEKLIEEGQDITWYFELDKESKEYSRFQTEVESCGGDPCSHLMHIGKNERLCNITYTDNEGKEATIHDCRVIHYHPYDGKAVLENLNGRYEIDDEKILEVEII